MGQRFLTLKQVAEELAVSEAQVYALIRNAELPAIKIGGRGQWRIERDKLEDWIVQQYKETARFIEQHPFTTSVDGNEPHEKS